MIHTCKNIRYNNTLGNIYSEVLESINLETIPFVALTQDCNPSRI